MFYAERPLLHGKRSYESLSSNKSRLLPKTVYGYWEAIITSTTIYQPIIVSTFFIFWQLYVLVLVEPPHGLYNCFQ